MSLMEMIAISYGVWNYAITNFVNIPFWLFLLWGESGAILYQASLEIKKLGVKK